VVTRHLLHDVGSFLYNADFYGDELPCWTRVTNTPPPMVPQSFVLNDNRYASGRVENAGDFLALLGSACRVLRQESRRAPRLMTISLHARLSGRPARFDALRRFLDLVDKTVEVWRCTRVDLARHWISQVPPPGPIC